MFARHAGSHDLWSDQWAVRKFGPVFLPSGDNTLDSSVESSLLSSQSLESPGAAFPPGCCGGGMAQAWTMKAPLGTQGSNLGWARNLNQADENQ